MLAIAGWAAPLSAQAANIDTSQPFYLASDLGGTLNPVFQGGVLRTDQIGGGYPYDFTLAGSGANTIDLDGHTSSFSGVFSDAVGGVPGDLTITDSVGGGDVTLSGVSTYTGATTINAGTLTLTGGIAASSGVNLTGASAVFDASGVGVGAQIQGLSGVAGSQVKLGAKGLTVHQAGATTFAGDISGSGASALIKTGAGTLTLSGVNSYTNATTISEGVLALSGSGSIAASGGVADDATLDISATTAGASITTLSGSGAVALGGQTLTLTNAADTFSGVIGGSGGVTVASGAETLSGVNTFTGATTINSGAGLLLSGSGGVSASSGVTDNGTFDISATTSGAAITSLSGSGVVTLGAQSLTLTNASGTFSGAIGGTGGLAVTGGAETLTGVNTYGGGTLVSNASLAIGGDAALGDAAGGLALDNAMLIVQHDMTSARGVTLAGSNTIDTDGAQVQLTGVIGGAGALVVAGSGRLNLTAVETYAGATTINSGSSLKLSAGGDITASSGVADNGTFDISGAAADVSVVSLSGAGVVSLGARTLTLSHASGTFSGGITGTGGLVLTGGSEALTGSSSYTGGTRVSGASLAINSDAALGGAGGALSLTNSTLIGLHDFTSARSLTLAGADTINTAGVQIGLSGAIGGSGGLDVTGGGRLSLTGVNTYAGGTRVTGASLAINTDAALGDVSGALALTNATLIAGHDLTSARTLTLSGAATIDTAGAQVGLSGAIGGGGALTVSGSGQLSLSGVNTYAGGTRITGAATLAVGSDTALGQTGSVVAFDHGRLLATADLTSARPILIAPGGGVLDDNGFRLDLSGPIALGGNLSTGGAGYVHFTGVAQGSGAVAITEGLFSNDGQISAGAVTVSAGATLRGTGVIAAPTTVSGTLAPGNSPGTLTFNASVTLQPGSVSAFDIDGPGTGTGAGNFSRVIVAGAGHGLTAGGVLEPRLRGITGSASNSYTPALGQRFQVISAAGGVVSSSSFTGLVQPAGLAAGTRFDAVYAPTSLTLVVTPAAYADMGGSGTANARAVGTALDANRPLAGVRMSAAQAAVYEPLYDLAADQVDAALNGLAPVIYADGVMAARQSWFDGAGAVSDQIADRRGADASAGPHGVTFWGGGAGDFSDTGPVGAGYHTASGGVVAGVDKATGGGRLIGFAVSAADLRTTAAGGDTASGALLEAMVYGGARLGRAFIDGQAGFVYMDQDLVRAPGMGGAVEGHNALKGGGGQVDAGLDLAVHNWLIEPTVGLSALGLTSTTANETAAAALAERVSAPSNVSLQALAGVRLATTVRLTPTTPLRLHGFAGWSHELQDTRAEVQASFAGLGGAPFTVTSAAIGRDAAKLGASFDAQLAPRVTVYGSYGATLTSGRDSQQVAAGVRVRW